MRSISAVVPPQDAQAIRLGRLAPCIFYLFVEFGRPMAWIPLFDKIHPGWIAGAWGLLTVILSKNRPIPRPIWYMFAFIALMAWEVPWATNNRWALWGFEDYSILVLGGVLPLAVLPGTVAEVRFLVSTYFFCHVPTAIHGLNHLGYGIGGWMGDENDLAFALNAAIGVGVYLLFESASRAKKLWILAALALMISAVVATSSRGGFVGFAMLGLFLFLIGPHRKAILGFTVAAAIGLAAFAPASYWEEVKSIRTAGEKGDTGEARLYFWGIAWKMFLDHPIYGVGTHNYGIRAPEYQDVERKGWNVHTWGRVAHSLFFTLLPEHGIIGVGIFFGMLGWLFRRQRDIRQNSGRDPENVAAHREALLASGMAAAILGALGTGLFLSVLYYPVLWVLAGLMGALDGALCVARERGTA